MLLSWVPLFIYVLVRRRQQRVSWHQRRRTIVICIFLWLQLDVTLVAPILHKTTYQGSLTHRGRTVISNLASKSPLCLEPSLWWRTCHLEGVVRASIDCWFSHRFYFSIRDDSVACLRKPSAHLSPYLRCALVFRVLVSSKIRNFPMDRTVRRKLASSGLVRQSANIIAVEIHLHWVLLSACSLICIASIVVLHSWQFGTASLVTRSNRDLQSVISSAFFWLAKAFSGFCHWHVGSFT